VLWKLTDDDWSSVLKINLDSAFFVRRALVPGMRELGRFGIRVNAVSPGYITTRVTRDLPAEIIAAARAETALDRLGEPIDVARAVLFMCSRLANHVTGQVLRVDGGQCTA
jgi:NAD(P)-dependent dehydrogenase (short-subunit alcohol dehydrogenase family)